MPFANFVGVEPTEPQRAELTKMVAVCAAALFVGYLGMLTVARLVRVAFQEFADQPIIVAGDHVAAQPKTIDHIGKPVVQAAVLRQKALFVIIHLQSPLGRGMRHDCRSGRLDVVIWSIGQVDICPHIPVADRKPKCR
jgi:hypothetical protein